MNVVRKFPGLQRLNAKRRAFEVEHRYASLTARYEREQQVPSFAELWSQRGLDELRFSDPPRVLYCGTDYLQDYGGFIQSLRKQCDLRTLERQNGAYGQMVDGVSWGENGAALAETLSRLHKTGWRPEILMMQSMGMRFHPSHLKALKATYGFAVINIGMDERLAYVLDVHKGVELGIRGLNEIVDLALVTAPEAVRWYLIDGVPAKYFPLASDSSKYYPIPSTKKSFDVGFIGRAYGQRLRLAKKIAESGLSFAAHGPGWGLGILEVDQNNEFYNRCRTVLGAGNIGYSKRLMNPKLRDFEVPLTAVPYITNYTRELAELYVEGAEIVLYRSESDLLQKLRWLIENPAKAEAIGRAGYRRAISNHLYHMRLEVLFGRLLKGDLTAEFVQPSE